MNKIKDKEVFLSIVIPVFNVEKYIKRCLESIEAADLNNVEIICINDGSSDASLEIIESIKQRIPYLEIVTQVNMGVSAARNKGLEFARGRYIWFVDGDDFVESKRISTLLNIIERDLYDLIWINYKYINEESGLESISHFNRNIYNVEVDRFLNKYYNQKGMPWVFIIKKNIIDHNNITFDTSVRFYEDEHFIYKVISYSKKICCLGDIYYNYLIRNDSALRNSNNNERLMDAFKVYCDLLEFSKDKEAFFCDFINKKSIHAFCWILREADELDASSFYSIIEYKNLLPLKLKSFIPVKLYIQVMILNNNFAVFRRLFKLR